MDNPANAPTPAVVDVTPQNFQELVASSQEKPLFLLFWAAQAPETVPARDELEREAKASGRFTLALVDVAQDQALAQQLQVQALPGLRVISGGQMVDQLDGPQPDGYSAVVQRHTMTSGELVREQLDALLAAGDHTTALHLVQQAAQAEPGNMELRVELADLLVLTGDDAGARELLATIAPDTAGRERPATRLELGAEAAALPARADLEARVAADGADLEARHGAAIRAIAEGDAEAALAHCMVILQTDRDWRDDLGRTTMLRIFTLLGKGNALATSYRRRMFAFLH